MSTTIKLSNTNGDVRSSDVGAILQRLSPEIAKSLISQMELEVERAGSALHSAFSAGASVLAANCLDAGMSGIQAGTSIGGAVSAFKSVSQSAQDLSAFKNTTGPLNTELKTTKSEITETQKENPGPNTQDKQKLTNAKARVKEIEQELKDHERDYEVKKDANNKKFQGIQSSMQAINGGTGLLGKIGSGLAQQNTEEQRGVAQLQKSAGDAAKAVLDATYATYKQLLEGAGSMLSYLAALAGR